MSPGLVRTLRIRSQRKAGGLGFVTTALGDAGASIGEIQTLRIGHNYTLRDFHLLLDDEEHLRHVLDAISAIAGSEIVEVVDTVKSVHLGGKIRMRSRVALDGIQDLSSAHMPGVKQMVQLLEDNPNLVDVYSSLPRTVAVISDGSGLVGMNKVHPRAMLPVVEAKCALLARLVGLSGLPIILDVDTEENLVETVARLAPSCSAILVDSIVAPRGPRAAQKLAERLQIPVLHDDADGPAVVGLAAVVNACRRVGKDAREVQIGQIGLGTAGGAIARLVMRHTGRPVIGDDVHPGAVSRHISNGGVQSNLDVIMQTADVVVMNTGHAGLIAPSSVREGQVIIALSEPNPEIEPYDAQLAGAAFAADGKAISPAAAFPGILLGALAVKATAIDDAMRIAAALTLADAAEGGDLVPTPLTDGLHARVAAAVARAAVESGRARSAIDPALLVAAVFQAIIDDERQLPLPAGLS